MVRHVPGWQVPLLVLGGGGYHNADSARCYAAIAAEIVGVKLPQDVPEHDYLHHYGMHARARKVLNESLLTSLPALLNYVLVAPKTLVYIALS